jgi:hypothetical protein
MDQPYEESFVSKPLVHTTIISVGTFMFYHDHEEIGELIYQSLKLSGLLARRFDAGV